MEQLSACIADRMIDLNIISSDDKDCYCYSVQGLLEKITCLTLIIVLAYIFHSLVGVIAFLSVFMLIRRSSDGIHCKTAVGCFFASTVISLSTIQVVRTINRNCAICIGGVVCAMIILCIIATYNNPDLNLTKEELNHLKRRSRFTSLITGAIVVIIISVFPEKEIVSYMALGVIYNAISLLIAILLERRNRSDDKEEA
ncbi:MAG: accessory gene regulator B family protein [Paludibacteraceae bacterium]|nr:accessory gene regulator B family protein [Clostridiales bacterium]MBP5423649.1 accessory gene regulator B family protein [Paludibacteraceae bacterium]